jgi:Zn-dependent M28 family amino/carboxypeptidase
MPDSATVDPQVPQLDSCQGEVFAVFTDGFEEKLRKWHPKFYEGLMKQYAGQIIFKQKLTFGVAQKRGPWPTIEILASRWNGIGDKLYFNLYSKWEPRHIARNVLGFVPGSERPDSFVVFTAHYDHLGRMGGKTYFPGANDNAAGVALLLELARYYAQPANKPRYSVLFIGFAGEEAGLIGSEYYTEHPSIPLNQIRFLFNLDLVGTGQEGATVVNATCCDTELKWLNEINDQYKLLPGIRTRPNRPNSDHYWFAKKGVPAFFIFTQGSPPHYHDVNDIPETLPLTKIRELFRLLTLLERRIDGRP